MPVKSLNKKEQQNSVPILNTTLQHSDNHSILFVIKTTLWKRLLFTFGHWGK